MQSVATLIGDGVAPFEFGVACEVFGIDRTDEHGPRFDHRVITEHPGPVRTNQGFSIAVTDDLASASTADLIVVPPQRDEPHPGPVSPAVLQVLKDAAARGAWIVSLCSGAFILGEAGLLDGRRCTTHWRFTDELQANYPTAKVDPEVLFVEDGNIITSAGTAASIDACLHWVRREVGAASANVVARGMVMPPQRDGGQSQYIATPLPKASSDSLAPVTDWMVKHLGEDLTVDALAKRAHMSARTFARRFVADLGTTPAAWLNRQRLIRAQELLEQTGLDLDVVAAQSGFGSAAVLRQHFSRTLHTTPSRYRARFCCLDELAG